MPWCNGLLWSGRTQISPPAEGSLLRLPLSPCLLPANLSIQPLSAGRAWLPGPGAQGSAGDPPPALRQQPRRRAADAGRITEDEYNQKAQISGAFQWFPWPQ